MADSWDASTGGGGASVGGKGGGTSASGGGGSGGVPNVPGRGGCGGALGCSSFGFSLRAALGTTWEDVNSYSVRVCRNDSCGNAELASLPSAPAPGSGQSLSLSPPLMDVVTVAVRNDAGEFSVSVQWPSIPSTFANGDIYLIRVTEASGSTVVTVRKRASYQTWTMNDGCSGNLLCGEVTLVDAPEEDGGTTMLPADAMPLADAMPPADATRD